MEITKVRFVDSTTIPGHANESWILGHEGDKNELFLCEPKAPAIQFSWNGTEMRKDIRDDNRCYTTKDPRTWPLVTSHHLRTESAPGQLKHAPLGIAYDKPCMDLLLETGLGSLGAGNHTIKCDNRINLLFACYPYNFARDGKPREQIGIPRSDFIAWMEMVNGPTWSVTHSAIARSKQAAERATRTESKGTEEAISVPKPLTELGDYLESTKRFEGILKSISEQKEASSAVDDLHYELKTLKIQLKKESQRANRIERDLKLERDNIGRLQQQLQQAEARATLAGEALRKATADNDELKRLMSSKDNALADAQNEVKLGHARIN